jgi:hypothetical protein
MSRPRKRNYQDSELAYRLKDFLENKKFKGININCIQHGARVYFNYQNKEYTAIFDTMGKERSFSLHLEKPEGGLVDSIKANLSIDSMFYKNPIFSSIIPKERLPFYQGSFKRQEIGESNLTSESEKEGEGKVIPTFVSRIQIKKIPLGKEGHLSDNFLLDLFNYNIRPVIFNVLEYDHNKLKTK